MSGEREETTIDGKSVNSDLIWTDNPELEYFRSMMTNGEGGRIETEDSLIGDSTIREMFEVAGNSQPLQIGVRDTSGLSDTESNKVDNIYIEDGSLLNRKPTQNSTFDDGTIETPEDEDLVPKTMKAPVGQNTGQNHQPNIEYETRKNNFRYVEPQCVFAPAEQIEPREVDLGEANTVAKESVSIPGFIFVTDGHPSIVQTKKNDPQSDQTTEKRSMCLPRTLLICMTLIVLVASTVIAVLVYQMNTGTSDLTSSSSQSQIGGSQTIIPNPQPTSAPTGLRGNNASQAPTPIFNSGDTETNDDSDVVPSMAPSVSIPNGAGTSPPTKSPTISPVNTPVPTLTFTDLPTIAPTYSPTSSPTSSPTNSPTNSPTSLTNPPTIMPAEAASVEPCVPTIETDVSCYENGDDIKISFNICGPTSTEWVGVYPASQGTSNLSNPLAWFKTCDDQECVGADENDGVGTIYNVSRRGRYRAYLIREDENSVYGYSAFARTERFAILGSCN